MNKTLTLAVHASLLLLLGFVGILYLSGGDMFLYDLWADRDLLRADAIFDEWQYMSAELSKASGARMPGALLYYTLKIPLLLSHDPHWLYICSLLLNFAACGVLYRLIRSDFGVTGGLFAAALYLCSDVFASVMLQLWNPGFMPLPLMLGFFYGYKAIVHGQEKRLKWMFLWFAVAAQMHITALILLGFVLLFLALRLLHARRWPLPRQAALCFLFFAIPLLPYIIGDASHGFANTKAVLAVNTESVRADKTPDNLFAFNQTNIHFLLKSPSIGKGVPVLWSKPLANLHLILAVLAALGLAFSLYKKREDWANKRQVQALLFMAFPPFCLYVMYAFTKNFTIDISSQRYLYAALPGISGVVGALASLSYQRLTRTPALAALAAIIVISWSGGVAFSSHYNLKIQPRHTALPAYSFYFRSQFFMYDDVKKFIANIQETTGWPLEEIQYRVMTWNHMPELGELRPQAGWYWGGRYAIDYLRSLQPGKPQPIGSVFKTGGIYIVQAKQQHLTLADITPAYIAKVMGQDMGNITISAKHEFGDDYFIVYTRAEGVVHSSLQNRYNLTTQEKRVEQYRGKLAEGEALLLPSDGEAIEYALNPGQHIIALLRITPTAKGSVIELHSNQLRGQAPNQGMFTDAMIEKPTLRLHRASGSTLTIPLNKGLVGHVGVMSPLIIDTTYKPSKGDRLEFSAGVSQDVDAYNWPTHGRKIKSITLTLPAP